MPAEPNSPPPTFQKAFLDEFVGPGGVGSDPMFSNTRAKMAITVNPNLKLPPGAQVLQTRRDGNIAMTCRNGTLIYAELTDTGETKWKVIKTANEMRDDLLDPLQQLFQGRSPFPFQKDISSFPGNQLGTPIVSQEPNQILDPSQFNVLRQGHQYSHSAQHSYPHPISAGEAQIEDILRGSQGFNGLMSELEFFQEIQAQERAALAHLERCFHAQKYLSQQDMQLYAEEKQKLLVRIATTHENIESIKEKAQSCLHDIPQQYGGERSLVDEFYRGIKSNSAQPHSSIQSSIQSSIVFPPLGADGTVQHTNSPETGDLSKRQTTKGAPTSRLSAAAPAFVPTIGREVQQPSDESKKSQQGYQNAAMANDAPEVPHDSAKLFNATYVPENVLVWPEGDELWDGQGRSGKMKGEPTKDGKADDLRALTHQSTKTALPTSENNPGQMEREAESQQPQVMKVPSRAQAEDEGPTSWTWARLPEESFQAYQERLVKRRKLMSGQDQRSRPRLGVDDENAPLQASGLVTKQPPNAAANALAVSMRRTFQRSSVGIRG